MAVPISTGAWGKLIYPKPFTGWVGLDYDTLPDMVPLLFEARSSDQSVEEVTVAGTLPSFQVVNEGGNTPYYGNNQKQTKRLSFVNYRMGFIVTQNLIEDGKGMNIVMENARELGRCYRDKRNSVASLIYDNAFTSETSADGAVAISASHSTSAGSRSNLITGNPGFSEAALEQAIYQIKDCRDDTGKRIGVDIDALVIPTVMEFDVSRVVNNPLRPGTTDRDVNATYSAGSVPEVIVNRYLSDADAYYYKTTQKKNGLLFFDRKGLVTSQDSVFDSDNLKFKGYGRYAGAIFDWRSIYGSNPT